MSVFAASRSPSAAAFGLCLAALTACVDIVGVENLSAAPPGMVDAGQGGAGKDASDSGYSGASGTIAIDGPSDVLFDVVSEGAFDGSDEAGESGADASACPVVRPVQGTACLGTMECVYDACSEVTLDLALATCQSGKWAVFSQPCALYPCGGLQCLFPRLLCVTVQGGAASCADNPCISPLSFAASCTCASDLCKVAPTYQCNPAATGSYVVTCTP